MKTILLFIIFFCLLGCNKSDNTIYKDKSFEDISSIANVNNSPFCIVLTDSLQSLSTEYSLLLQDRYKFMTNRAIFNIVDINSQVNEWYVKWLCPISTPLTCVFSAKGTLVDLIPGAAIETFLYAEDAVKNIATTEYHWPNQFNIDKKKIIPLLNNILQYKNNLNNGSYISSGLDPLVDSLHYPYLEYLKLVGKLMMHDTIASRLAAESLVELEMPYYLKIYKDEFITAKKILNPNFNINNEPNIRVNENVISLSDCLLNKDIPIDIVVYNDGYMPLKISKVYTSCSCVKKINCNEELVVNAKGCITLKFNFTPEMDGEISRDIFITSNAINMPILYINILANSVSNNTNN